MNAQQQADNDALASVVGAAAQQLGLGVDGHGDSAFASSLQAAGFGGSKSEDDDDGAGEEELLLDDPSAIGFGRPPSIRKACDLCHAAKQKCSGERPSCVRCQQGGWQCNYAPRQRRRRIPRERISQQSVDPTRGDISSQVAAAKKRKLGPRDTLGFGDADLKAAMGLALEMGLGDDEAETIQSMTDDQMLESIAIDGYLADLPLSTFVHNLPFTAPPPEAGLNFNPDDFSTAAEMDQHTTSALRDAIFSLNESSGHTVDQTAGADQQENHDDQHLALLDLSHAMPGDEPGEGGTDGLHLNLPYNSCAHSPLVPHILSLLTQHSLDPKPGSNTPLNLEVFAPLARSLRLFGAITSCVHCMSSVQQTLPQLALLSRTTTILTFPYPPITSASGAQITLHGARLTGTGLSEAIEQHIVGVVWDSWRASVREIFTGFERKAQDVITSSALMAANQNTDGENQNQGSAPSSAETQRAGLIFQAMSRLVTAMDEVEER